MKGNEVEPTRLPGWLDVQAIAIIGTVLTVAVGIRTEIGGLRTEMHGMHKELTDQIDALDDRVRKVELTVVRRPDG